MFDAVIRPWIDPPLGRLAAWLDGRVSANAVTVAGFGIGMLAALAISQEYYLLGALGIALNRVGDGLDGALARRQGITDFGGFLDITLDFIFYSSIVFAFAFADPQANALAAAFLIFSFVGTGCSFLAFAIIAARRNLSTDIRGRKSFYYLGGLTEGTETILLLLMFCAIPAAFAPLAWSFGALCWITTATRIAAAKQSFSAQ